MKSSVAAHAAARQVSDPAAIAAARAAGHAVATAHFADHCMGALLYAMKAMEAAGVPSVPEMELRLEELPGGPAGDGFRRGEGFGKPEKWVAVCGSEAITKAQGGNRSPAPHPPVTHARS